MRSNKDTAKTAFNQRLGKRMLNLIKILGMTQKAFAEQVGISYGSYLGHILRGEKMPSAYIIKRIAEEFPQYNCIGYLMEAEPLLDQQTGENVGMDLNREIAKLSPADRELIENMVARLRKAN